MLNQSLQQKMQQRLSPLQIQIMKLIEIPAVQLEQRIKEELEQNPVLEEVESDKRADDDEEVDIQDHDNDDPRDTSIEEYLKLEQETPAYKLQTNNYSPDDQRDEVPYSEGASFLEHLEEQIGLQNMTEDEELIAHYIIGNIDEDGYLRREVDQMADDISFATNKDVDSKDVQRVLEIVQRFDPLGVGARDLRESLLLQLRGRNLQDPINNLAYRVIDECFEEFTKKHYEKILKKLRIEEEDDLKDAMEEILRLNPKPGSTYSGSIVKTAQAIIPDFIVEYENERLSFRLNSRNEPQLRLSQTYTDMLEEYMRNKQNQTNEQKEAVTFVRQKLDAAKWFIDAIKQRRNTLHLVMQAIMDYQGEYFIDGDEKKLKPMILKDIAEITGLDASTISRVTNSKYVQTPFGIYSLKYFFSEKMQSTDGDDVSSREVKKILQESIDAEDKRQPIADEKLAEILQEKGYNIARRTVAKYREQLGIPVARLRKEL
ncbi:MAG: RNA polymerase factor sigma-54 [Marinilabiliaceae bacterium]|nr:RNA polymerase factor sigma-54 [Marinilabiliaceae bacterium]